MPEICKVRETTTESKLWILGILSKIVGKRSACYGCDDVAGGDHDNENNGSISNDAALAAIAAATIQ